MKLVLSGNPLFQSNSLKIPPKPSSPSGSTPDSSSQLSPGITPSTGDSGIGVVPAIQLKKKPNVVTSLTPVVAFAGLALLIVPLGLYLCKLKKANSSEPPSSLVIHPLDLFNSDNTVRISVAKDTQMLACVGSGSSESPVIKSGNMIISVQVLKKRDQNFAKESELGHGGFGVIYKGQVDHGTKIAVERMESGVIYNKALDEYESEISVLTKVSVTTRLPRLVSFRFLILTSFYLSRSLPSMLNLLNALLDVKRKCSLGWAE
ncbi:putative non-specific serine/threonine protein kinase [Helianthus annuus]|nr:putative non-specific serine/threonine protein kinase [Helianthus annuus]